MRTARVSYCGVPLDCSYEFSPAEPQTWTEPGNPADAALHYCKVGGVDIYEMLSENQIAAIEVLILEAHGEQAEHDACEAADNRRQEMLMERGYP